MIKLLCILTLSLLLLPSVGHTAENDLKKLVVKYTKASWGEQSRLRGKIFASADEIIPIVVARLKEEEFTKEKIQKTCPSLDFNSADILEHLFYEEQHKLRVIDLTKPLLNSKDTNERGWSNYILKAANFDGALDDMPDLLNNEKSDDVLWAILERLFCIISRSYEAGCQKTKTSIWRGKLVKALAHCLKSEDEYVLRMAGECLQEIPSRKSTAIAVNIIKNNGVSAPYLVDLLRQRIGFKGTAPLNQKQQESVVSALIQMKMNNPDSGSDTLTDVIMDIPDKRVLPAFFSMLEKYKDNRNVQRQVSYCIWILFTRDDTLREKTPREIYDMKELNKHPMKSGELWRQWYKTNKDKLIWNEKSITYCIKQKNAEQVDPTDSKESHR